MMDGAEFASGSVGVLYCARSDWTEVPHMTLVVGVCAADAIVLVADGRITRPALDGRVIDTDDAKKLYGFGRFGIGVSGFNGLVDNILDSFRDHHTLDACPNIRVAKAAAESQIRDYMRRFHGFPLEAWPRGALLLAGYGEDGEPHVYSLHCNAAYEGAPFHWVGTQRGGIAADSLVKLLLVGRWRSRPTREQAAVFGVLAVQLANHVDPDVGPPRGMAVITPDGGYEDITDQLPECMQRSAETENRIRGAFAADS